MIAPIEHYRTATRAFDNLSSNLYNLSLPFLQDILGLHNDSHRITHQVTCTIDQLVPRNVPLVIPGPSVVRPDGVTDDEDAVAEVLAVDGGGDDADWRTQG